MLIVATRVSSDPPFLWLLAAVILLLFLIPLYLVVKFLLLRIGRHALPYRRASAVLSPGEAVFFKVLVAAVEDRFRVFAKVRLADVIEVEGLRNSRAWWVAFNRISSKHLDFVICDTATYGVMGVIELDDKSHRSLSAQKSDAFKDAALHCAGIPILRIPARASYSKAAITDAIKETFKVPPPIPM